jgi:hypothetical protein
MNPVIKGRLYWAGRGFTHRGLWWWTGKRNVRVLPLNKIRQWNGVQGF